MNIRTKLKAKKTIFSAAVLCLAALQITAANPAQALGVPDISTSMASSMVDEIRTTIAPGLTQKEFVYIDQAGKRLTCFTMEYNPAQASVTLAAGTPHDGTKIGMATVRNQAGAAISKGKQVVAAINADMYNMKTGDPWGVVVKDGAEIHSYAPIRTWWKFFGVKTDGTPIYGDRQVYEANKGSIQQALGIHSILVDNSAVVNTDLTSTLAPRNAVGVRSDHSVFFLLVDGRKDPYSHGLTLEQTAQLMKDLGAVWAGNLDGGGSSTLLTRTPGDTALTVKNHPSDGWERAVDNSWLFIANPKKDGIFASAALTPYDKTYSPKSIVQISTKGLDFSGAPASLPASGLSWELSDASFGTMDQNGLFSSNGKEGQVQVQLWYNGQTVGSTYIEIATPDNYVSVSTMLPTAGQNAGITATYQGREVILTMKKTDW
nr:phosphodiester glycosidase family protein [uncultured Caproiciproducens sp.]